MTDNELAVLRSKSEACDGLPYVDVVLLFREIRRLKEESAFHAALARASQYEPNRLPSRSVFDSL